MDTPATAGYIVTTLYGLWYILTPDNKNDASVKGFVQWGSGIAVALLVLIFLCSLNPYSPFFPDSLGSVICLIPLFFFAFLLALFQIKRRPPTTFLWRISAVGVVLITIGSPLVGSFAISRLCTTIH